MIDAQMQANLDLAHALEQAEAEYEANGWISQDTATAIMEAQTACSN